MRSEKIGAGRDQACENEIALAAIAEQRHEIGDEAVDRLDDPGEVERRERGGDLHRRPGMDLLEVVDERLRDDAVGLADAFDHEDHAKIEHQVADAPRVVERRGEGRRRLSLCSGGQKRSLGQRSDGRALIASPAPAAKRKRFAAAAGVDCGFKAMRCPAELANRAMLRQSVEARARRRPKPGGGMASYVEPQLARRQTSRPFSSGATKYETVINMKTAMAFCDRLAEICSPRDFLRMDAKHILVASRRL